MRVLCSLLVSLSLAVPALAQHVWWEAESKVDTNFPAQTWLSGRSLGKQQEQLAGGEWLTSAGPRAGDELRARWQVTVPAAGRYTLWTRKFWKHGPFRWRFDAEEPRVCGADCALADSVALIPNVCANWVDLGTVELTAGEHAFEVVLQAAKGQETTAAFDCFLLTQVPFVPDGKRKPGEKEERVDAGMFAFAPPADPFADGALLDLRGLNEKVAGERGPVRAKGDGFVRGDGQAMRWFGVNAGPDVWMQSQDGVNYLARKLAKLGVNLVRLHGPLVKDGQPRQVDAQRLDAICYFIAACKQQGIYTTLSNYFPLWFRINGAWGIADYDGTDKKHPFGAIYFDERLQAIQRGWLQQVLTHENPYTKVKLAREPALAAIEMVNEDSLFFWTFTPENIPPAQWRTLEGRFGKWLKQTGPAKLLPAWNMTRDGLGKTAAREQPRVREQIRFLAETQRDYYAGLCRYVQKELGYDGLTVASNWHVSDPAQLDAIERWTYQPADIVDAHGYFAGSHEGPRAAWALDQGDRFRDAAFVDAPERLPLQSVQTMGKPQIVSEIGWPSPNRLRADGVLVASAYAAANGVDGLFWFAIESPFLRDAGVSKFGIGTPDQAWTFPVAALLYRRFDVAEAEPVRRAALSEAALFALGGSDAGAAQLDPLRAGDGPNGVGLDVRVFLTGPVVRAFDSKAAGIRQPPAKAGEGARVTRHKGGQLVLDEGRRLFTIDAPRCQAASGYLGKAGKVELEACAIECRNDYGAVAVISLDGEPIARSKRILVQAITKAQPFGFVERGGRIEALGSAPAQVEHIAAVLTLRGGPIRRVVALDSNGMARPDVIRATGSPVVITLASDALWHVIER